MANTFRAMGGALIDLDRPAQPTPGPLTVGVFLPSADFRAQPEHVAVLRAGGRGLVAVTGYTGAPPQTVAQSLADAVLFAGASDLLRAVQSLTHLVRAMRAMHTGGVTEELVGEILAFADEAIARAQTRKGAIFDAQA